MTQRVLDRQNNSCTLISLFLICPFLLYVLPLFSFPSLLYGLAILLGVSFNFFIPVTASLFPLSFSHHPSFLLHSLHAPAYRELLVFPIRIHLAVESAVLHSQVCRRWFAIHSSGYGFTLTGIDKEAEDRDMKTRAKRRTGNSSPPSVFQCPPLFFRHWDAAAVLKTHV